MLGIFSIFGRSLDQQLLDQALRTAGVHPRLVPDAVKITTLKLLRTGCPPKPTDADRAACAQLLAYGILGPEDFGDINGTSLTEAVETRFDAALDAGDSLDAQLILLLLHAGLLDEGVTGRYDLAHE